MENSFLAQGYIALSLIQTKKELFNEEFVTTSELSQFVQFMQMYFVKKRLAIAITSYLEEWDFQIQNGIITITDTCSFDLDRVLIYHDLEWNSVDIGSILKNMNLIVSFFIQLENRKLSILEEYKNKGQEEQSDTSFERKVVLENKY